MVELFVLACDKPMTAASVEDVLHCSVRTAAKLADDGHDVEIHVTGDLYSQRKSSSQVYSFGSLLLNCLKFQIYRHNECQIDLRQVETAASPPLHLIVAGAGESADHRYSVLVRNLERLVAVDRYLLAIPAAVAAAE